eukprot:913471-Pyramimonas_sp.AAC.1
MPLGGEIRQNAPLRRLRPWIFFVRLYDVDAGHRRQTYGAAPYFQCSDGCAFTAASIDDIKNLRRAQFMQKAKEKERREDLLADQVLSRYLPIALFGCTVSCILYQDILSAIVQPIQEKKNDEDKWVVKETDTRWCVPLSDGLNVA